MSFHIAIQQQLRKCTWVYESSQAADELNEWPARVLNDPSDECNDTNECDISEELFWRKYGFLY